MNYVPFEFMDSVAATLRHLPSSKELRDTHDDFSEWKDAFTNSRRSRGTYTMGIVKKFERSERLKLGICFFPDNVMLRRLNVEEFLELDRNSTQIHKITIAASIKHFTTYNTNVQSVGEFSEIVEEIKTLTNRVTLEISYLSASQNFLRDYVSVLGEIAFFEIGSTARESEIISESFLTKQLESNTLKKCSLWPERWSPQFTLAVEEFLTTQPFEEIHLPNRFKVSKELLVRISKNAGGAKKKIYFQTNFELLGHKGNVMSGGKNDAQIRVELLGGNGEERNYVMTIYPDVKKIR